MARSLFAFSALPGMAAAPSPAHPFARARMQVPFGNSMMFPPGPRHASNTVPGGSFPDRAGTTPKLTGMAFRQPT